METKICSKCSVEKLLLEFNVCSRVKDGRKAECRECQKIGSKKYKSENKDKIKEYNRKWNFENKNYYQEYRKIWEVKNYDKVLKKRQNFNKNNPNYYNNYNKERKKIDVLFKLKVDMRNSVNRYLKYRSQKTFDIVGCSPQFLKEYLQNQFTKEMSWDNHGLFGWHIDHIIPLSSANTEEEMYELCHYTNLQPLWAGDNLKKSSKLI
jgi:hypothetical protein